MAIPDFQSIMLPLLRFLEDGQVHDNQEIYEALADRFDLTKQEKEKLLPSGKQRVFINRVAWAKSHLKQAGLIEAPERARYKISKRGLTVLADRSERVDINRLLKYPEYAAFRDSKSEKQEIEQKTKEVESFTLTPEEYLEYGYNQIKNELGASVIEQVKKTFPHKFEEIVVDLLLAMGYGGSRLEAGQVTQKTGDGGIDGIINEDKLGLDVIYIQAKRWEGAVGRPEIQKFAGALQGKRARKGIFITTSNFSAEAEKFAKSIDSKIILIDGERLAKLMIEHNVGVSTTQTYEIKKVDLDYYLEE